LIVRPVLILVTTSRSAPGWLLCNAPVKQGCFRLSNIHEPFRRYALCAERLDLCRFSWGL